MTTLTGECWRTGPDIGKSCQRGVLLPEYSMGTTMAPARIWIGIDTGGTFTDVVALDQDIDRLVSVTTRSTPGAQGRGFPAVAGKAVLPFFDGHPGYARLPGWAPCADVDPPACPGADG